MQITRYGNWPAYVAFADNIREDEGQIMDKKINLTQEELQLIYAACMMYGNELAYISKTSSPTGSMSKSLKARAEEFWNLGKKIKLYVEGMYGTDNKADD